MNVPPVSVCPRCFSALSPGALVCPMCGGMVYAPRLEHLAQQALKVEATDPAAASGLWREVLELLPRDSQQYRAIYDRLMLLGRTQGSGVQTIGADSTNPQANALAMGFAPDAATVGPPPTAAETAFSTLYKTGGSVLLNILIYTLFFAPISKWAGVPLWAAPAGFVVIILIHELGHLLAIYHYGMKAGAPVFIPFIGALINLRENPANAKVEAVIGIGGPLLGTLGAIGALAIYQHNGSRLALFLAAVGFMLNLFNMLPVPPLDGGRITAAVSPKIWMLGVATLVGWVVWGFLHGNVSFILLLILFFAWPRISATLRNRLQAGPYYDISRRSSVVIGAAYLALGVLLLALFIYTRGQLRAQEMGIL